MSSEGDVPKAVDAALTEVSASSFAKPSWRRRIFGVAAKLGLFWAGVLLIVALVLLAAVWGLGKTAMLKYAVAEVVNFSEGRLKVEGLEGSLFGSLRIAKLEAIPKGLKVPRTKIGSRRCCHRLVFAFASKDAALSRTRDLFSGRQILEGVLALFQRSTEAAGQFCAPAGVES